MPAGIEIERKYLLDRLPPVPPGAECWRIEQGYLSPEALLRNADASTTTPSDVEFGFGRLRRTIMADGSVVCTHTLKIGSGLQRAEKERVISEADFHLHWPKTEGRRIRKTRWRVPHGSVTWEIDDIEDGWIALAEVELETAEQVAKPPQWLAPHILRDVTDDPAYTNSALALRVRSMW